MHLTVDVWLLTDALSLYLLTMLALCSHTVHNSVQYVCMYNVHVRVHFFDYLSQKYDTNTCMLQQSVLARAECISIDTHSKVCVSPV